MGKLPLYLNSFLGSPVYLWSTENPTGDFQAVGNYMCIYSLLTDLSIYECFFLQGQKMWTWLSAFTIHLSHFSYVVSAGRKDTELAGKHPIICHISSDTVLVPQVWQNMIWNPGEYVVIIYFGVVKLLRAQMVTYAERYNKIQRIQY